MADQIEKINSVATLFQVVEGSDAKALRTLMDELRQKVGDAAIVLASEHQGKAVLVATVSKSLHAQITAGDLLKVVAEVLGGRGGGRPDMAQGGADSLDNVEAAFQAARDWVSSATSG